MSDDKTAPSAFLGVDLRRGENRQKRIEKNRLGKSKRKIDPVLLTEFSQRRDSFVDGRMG